MPRHEGKAPSSVTEIALLAKVFDEHRDRLTEMVRRRIGPALASRVDPEDVLSEAFLRARDRWSSHDPAKISTYAWLYRIVLDAIVAAWRNANAAGRAIRREEAWPERSSIQLGMGLVGSATSPSEALIKKEQRERIVWAVQQLKPEDREVLAMHHFDELAYREVGAILEISEEAAAQRYARALLRLKRLWVKIEPHEES
jgi:RNA polymerase sigma-70 factor, ECF subfamily